jgi:hypothetical protein
VSPAAAAARQAGSGSGAAAAAGAGSGALPLRRVVVESGRVARTGGKGTSAEWAVKFEGVSSREQVGLGVQRAQVQHALPGWRLSRSATHAALAVPPQPPHPAPPTHPKNTRTHTQYMHALTCIHPHAHTPAQAAALSGHLLLLALCDREARPRGRDEFFVDQLVGMRAVHARSKALVRCVA